MKKKIMPENHSKVIKSKQTHLKFSNKFNSKVDDFTCR